MDYGKLILESIPVWIQAITGIGVFLIAVITFLQQSQIKTLTDVVAQLKDSNTIMKNRFEMERSISRKERMPIFIMTGASSSNRSQLYIRITLQNFGKDAFKVNCKDVQNQDKYRITISKDRVGRGHELQIEFKFDTAEIMNEPPIDFNLSFEDDTAGIFSQRIYKTIARDIQIDPPSDDI